MIKIINEQFIIPEIARYLKSQFRSVHFIDINLIVTDIFYCKKNKTGKQ